MAGMRHPRKPEASATPAHQVCLGVAVVPWRPAHGIHQLVPEPSDVHAGESLGAKCGSWERRPPGRRGKGGGGAKAQGACSRSGPLRVGDWQRCASGAARQARRSQGPEVSLEPEGARAGVLSALTAELQTAVWMLVSAMRALISPVWLLRHAASQRGLE